MNALPMERVTPRGFLSLDNYANLSAAHPWVDAGQFRSWLFVAVLGANSSPSRIPRKNGSTNLVQGLETMNVTVSVWLRRSMAAA